MTTIIEEEVNYPEDFTRSFGSDLDEAKLQKVIRGLNDSRKDFERNAWMTVCGRYCIVITENNGQKNIFICETILEYEKKWG